MLQSTFRSACLRRGAPRRTSPLTVIQSRNVIYIQSAVPRPNYAKLEVGEKGTPSYRMFLGNKKAEAVEKISLWHDIKLEPGKSEEGERLFNFVIEIPRGGSDKLEMSQSEEYNPIKHDLVGDKIRKIKYHPFVWNYGFFPQTWEDPNVVCPRTGLKGDGDPLDVVDIGLFSPPTGDVIHVKVIGALGLIDQGETDWKIIAINISDPKAAFINSIEDLNVHKKGVVEGLRDFWINYKTADGKPKNKLALDGKLLDRAETFKLIDEMHQSYLSQKQKGF